MIKKYDVDIDAKYDELKNELTLKNKPELTN